ncbi:SRPBCC family protein [Microvirga mediterraneensis]|uniref:SRPBCC family protein n=1 Tax=Microvirga mediterraneensis TaxID=2754695 RepID=A0A838BTR4_9HYPH|nr:SRPBCC family protein [Microvirga mediterraneensis]MBA1158449.1 SRPBCC family protein [Microvirga mediterraneensis]
MTDLATLDAYGALTEPATLTIQRLLPGPVERIWAYLTQSDLRARWLAAGDMDLTLGAPLELVWRNDGLSDLPTRRPHGFPEEQRMTSRITELDPPHRLSIAWGSTGDVTFTLEPQGADVLLTVTHHRVTDRATLLNISAGWHTHLDILAARVSGETPEPFWESWERLKEEYGRRFVG